MRMNNLVSSPSRSMSTIVRLVPPRSAVILTLLGSRTPYFLEYALPRDESPASDSVTADDARGTGEYRVARGVKRRLRPSAAAGLAAVPGACLPAVCLPGVGITRTGRARCGISCLATTIFRTLIHLHYHGDCSRPVGCYIAARLSTSLTGLIGFILPVSNRRSGWGGGPVPDVKVAVGERRTESPGGLPGRLHGNAVRAARR